MRILIVNRHYGDEHVPTGRMAADVTAEFMAAGHEVTVMTAKSSYSITAGSASGPSDGVKLIHLYTMGEKRRLMTWLLFLIQAWLRIPFMRWDRCILLTDPPFLSALTILLCPLVGRMAKVFWWTMDLYPEILVSSGRLKDHSILHSILKRINTEIIRKMGGFILLGDCQLERMRCYSTWQDRDYIIVPPWDRRPIKKIERANNRFLAKYGLQEKKVALYAGNLGEGHTYDSLLEAARELVKAERDDWVFVFVVRGSKKRALIEVAQNVPPIIVLDYQPLEWTSDLLWAAHVHLITMNAQSKGLVVPSKLYGVLQTDSPVLFVGPEDDDTAQEIKRYKAGKTLDETCTGLQVVEMIDNLNSKSDALIGSRILQNNTGPERIADFVTR